MELSREAVPPRNWLWNGTPPDNLHQHCSDAAFVALFMLHFRQVCTESVRGICVALSVKQQRT